MSLSDEEARRILKEISKTAGAYGNIALEARSKYIDLRLKQDLEIRKLYSKTGEDIAAELRKHPNNAYLKDIDPAIQDAIDKMNQDLTSKMQSYIENAAAAGIGYSKGVTIDLIEKAELKNKIKVSGVKNAFDALGIEVAKTTWERTKKGYKLSDRIWQTGEDTRKAIRDIIQAGIDSGQDAAKTARMLERYVNGGAKTLTAEYPNMMDHMGGRVPQDLSYEALRLTRTETTAAFGEGTIEAAQEAPSYIGMKWILSNSHAVPDECNTLATDDDDGLGPGVYKPGNEPEYPAHPNCLCVLVPVHEQPEEFVKRLKRWDKDPDSEPDIEKWSY